MSRRCFACAHWAQPIVLVPGSRRVVGCCSNPGGPVIGGKPGEIGDRVYAAYVCEAFVACEDASRGVGQLAALEEQNAKLNARYSKEPPRPIEWRLHREEQR